MGQCFSGGGQSKKDSQLQLAKPDFGLTSQFVVIKQLGAGIEGETWLCRDIASNKELAIKLTRRPLPKAVKHVTLRSLQIQAEICHGHPNIVAAREVVLTKSHIGLVMEYVMGGSMVHYVGGKLSDKSARGGLCLDEDEACYYYKQLVSAVEFCHGHNVAHRDLKLDNTLMTNNSPPHMKLCDFGFAKQWGGGACETLFIGTAEYMGPELMSSKSGYDGKKVDVWASGVILFVMLFGKFPFEANEQASSNTMLLHDLWQKQLKTSWQEAMKTEEAAKRLTPDCLDLLNKIFDVNAETRISLDAIKAHPWFTRTLPEKYTKELAVLAKQTIPFRKAAPIGKTSVAGLLEAIVDKACQEPLPNEDITRVQLVRDPADGGPLNCHEGIAEAEEESKEPNS